MKKTLLGILALTMALTVLCSACGGNTEKAPEATEAPAEATELPTVTKPPEEAEETGMVGANANNNVTLMEGMDRDTWLASLSEDQRLVEEELIGATVEELYKAIGEPKSSYYSTSCMVVDGEDGMLYYDGFSVSTTRFPSGMEMVMGTSLIE